MAETAGREPRQRTDPGAQRAIPTVRRSRKAGGKRRAILAAALTLFSRYGLHGTSVDQVAALSGVSKSNLLYHFESKEALYVSVLQALLDDWLAPFEAISAEQDPEDAIRGYIRAKLESARDAPEASRLFCLEVVQGAPLLHDVLAHALKNLVDEKSDVIRAWASRGGIRPDVDPYHMVFMLWAVTQHYADFAVQVHAITGRSLADPAYFEQTVEQVQAQVLGGLVPR